MSESVSKVFNDERPGKGWCSWCGKTLTDMTKCIHCGKDDYIQMFKPDPLQAKDKEENCNA